MALIELYPQTDIANDFWTPSVNGQNLSSMLNQAANEPASPLRYIVCGDSTSASATCALGSNSVMTHVPTQVRIGVRGQTNTTGGIARQLTFAILDPSGVEVVSTAAWTVPFPWTRVYATITNPAILEITDWSNYRLRATTGSSTTGKKSDRRELWLDGMWIEITTNDAEPIGGWATDGSFFTFF
jgi:hypothetical protein